MEINNLAAGAAEFVQMALSSRLLGQISLEMLEDQTYDQVACSRSRPHDQNTEEPTCNGSACGQQGHAGTEAPLHFGHRGGCASSPLSHGLDFQASRTVLGKDAVANSKPLDSHGPCGMSTSGLPQKLLQPWCLV